MLESDSIDLILNLLLVIAVLGAVAFYQLFGKLRWLSQRIRVMSIHQDNYELASRSTLGVQNAVQVSLLEVKTSSAQGLTTADSDPTDLSNVRSVLMHANAIQILGRYYSNEIMQSLGSPRGRFYTTKDLVEFLCSLDNQETTSTFLPEVEIHSERGVERASVKFNSEFGFRAIVDTKPPTVTSV
jgi:hypothetical protein